MGINSNFISISHLIITLAFTLFSSISTGQETDVFTIKGVVKYGDRVTVGGGYSVVTENKRVTSGWLTDPKAETRSDGSFTTSFFDIFGSNRTKVGDQIVITVTENATNKIKGQKTYTVTTADIEALEASIEVLLPRKDTITVTTDDGTVTTDQTSVTSPKTPVKLNQQPENTSVLADGQSQTKVTIPEKPEGDVANTDKTVFGPIESNLSITLSSSEVAFGQLLDLTGELINSTVEAKKLQGLPVVITFTSPGGQLKKLEIKTTTEGRFGLVMPYQMDAVGVWSIGVEVAGDDEIASVQREKQVLVGKGQAKFLLLSQTSTELGKTYPIQGRLLTNPNTVKKIGLKVVKPDAEWVEQTLQSKENGEYKYDLIADQEGQWNVTLTWLGNANYQRLEETFTFQVVKQFGKAIVVLGGVNAEKEREWKNFNGLAKTVYQTLVDRGFDPDQDIYFLSPEPTLTQGADAETTIETLESSIVKWAGESVNQNVPLYLYLLSHNLEDRFLLDSRSESRAYLSPQQLADWLDQLPAETATTIVVEACYSGRFITPELSRPNRIIITSTRSDKQARILPSSSFSTQFFQQIAANQTIRDAFEQTAEMMNEANSLHLGQFPQLEANGNAKANEWLDFSAVGQRWIPGDITALAIPPTLGQAPEPIEVRQATEGITLSIEATGAEIERVFAAIIPPDYDPLQKVEDWQSLDSLIIGQDLVPSETDPSTYQLIYDGFSQLGAYTIVFHAQNADGSAQPVSTTITVVEKPTAPELTESVEAKAKIGFVVPQTPNLGQEMSITVQVQEAINLAGWAFDLSYDPKLLSLQTVQEGDFLKPDGQEAYFQPGTIDPETGSVTDLLSVFLGAGGAKGTGRLLTLIFKPIAIGQSQLQLKNVELGDATGKVIPVKVEDTTVEVTSALPGDANVDGIVNILDLVKVANSFGQTGTDLEGDVNADGKIDILDLVKVAKYFGQQQTLNTAPSAIMVTLSGPQKQQVSRLISKLEGQPNLDSVTVTTLNLLKALVPESQSKQTQLLPNYPNPFNPETWIPFQLADTDQDKPVAIIIYDVVGNLIRTIEMGRLKAGRYLHPGRSAYWDGSADSGELVSSGLYFYSLQVGDYYQTRQMVILK